MNGAVLDWVQQAVNLILERLDRIAAALERIASAAEEEEPT